MGSLAEFYASLSSDPSARGREFEVATKQLLTVFPMWSNNMVNVWLWEEWPLRDGPDFGIDLVCQDKSGDLWAVQCKAYAPDRKITKAQIDSFVSASGASQFVGRILVTTAQGLASNAIRLLKSVPGKFVFLDWGTLEKYNHQWTTPRTKAPARPQKKVLRDYQIKAVNAVVEGLEKCNRGQLVMACGTGKTVTSLRIYESLQADTTVVLLPSLTLLSQTLQEWVEQRYADFAWLAVCSDSSVSGDEKSSDSVLNSGFIATTSKHEIVAFLSSPGRKVIFSTYHSSSQVLASFQQGNTTLDLLIADEAHRLAGSPSSDFAALALSGASLIQKRLFMTATPRIFAKKKSKELDELGVLSMDNENLFGSVFYSYSLGQAISDGNLCDYQVMVVGVEDIATLQSIENRDLVRAAGVSLDAASLATHVALQKAIIGEGISKAISFHSRISKARSFVSAHAELLPWMEKKLGRTRPFEGHVVSSEEPTALRRKKLSSLASASGDETHLLANARCLTEGIDVPSLDAVIFVDPRSSQVDIIQAVGRAIRKGGESKTKGHIILPFAIANDEEDVESRLGSSAYAAIWNVLNALRSHDPTIGEELDNLRRSLGSRSSWESPGKIIWDLPEDVSPEIIQKIKTRIIRSSSSAWEEGFGAYQAHLAANPGKLVVRQDFRDRNGYALGSWLSRQRTDFNNNRLSSEQVEKLEKLGVIWDPSEVAWEQSFDAAKAFFEEYGHLKPGKDFQVSGVLKVYRSTENLYLHRWVRIQITTNTQGELSPERVKRLEEIGIQWDERGDILDLRLRQLEEFRLKNGRDPLERDDKMPDGFAIGSWYSLKRSRLRKGSFDPETREKLINAGIDTETEEAGTWRENFEDCRDLFAKSGNVQIPSGFKGRNGANLTAWMASQKRKMRNGELPAERAKLLAEIGVELPKVKSGSGYAIKSWAESLTELSNFIDENHRYPSRQENPVEKRLANWVSIQRREHKKGSLPKKRIEALESIGFLWRIRD